MKKKVVFVVIFLCWLSFVFNGNALTLSALSGRSLNNISDQATLDLFNKIKDGSKDSRTNHRAPNDEGNLDSEVPGNQGMNLNAMEETKTPPFYAETYPADLQLFGQEYFVQGNIPRPGGQLATIPGDYVLGPGDEFRLLFTGKELKEVDVFVDNEGQVLVPDMGLVPAAGLRFNEFKTMLASKIKQKLIGLELDHIATTNLRTIRVFLLGNVRKPGTHTISALSSVMQLLLDTGGILPVGSLRTLQIKRVGSPDKKLDLYNVLIGGKNDGDLRLQDGDTVFVPTIGKTIALTGTVKKPAIYELSNEKTIDEALQLAGGMLPNSQSIKVERISKNKNRIVVDLDLRDSASLHAAIKSGDIVHVLPASNARRDTVTLLGYVERGGVFQWTKSMKLTDLISGPSELLPQTDLSHVLIIRTNPRNRQLEPLSVNLERALMDRSSADNITLEPNDQIQLFSLGSDRSQNVQSVVDRLKNQGRFNHADKTVTIKGNVRFPGDYPFVNNMDLRQLITASGDIRDNTDMDYCLIARSDYLGRLQPFSVRLREVLGMEGGTRNIPLNPRDQVFVFRIDEKHKDLSKDKLLPMRDFGADKELFEDKIRRQEEACKKRILLENQRSNKGQEMDPQSMLAMHKMQLQQCQFGDLDQDQTQDEYQDEYRDQYQDQYQDPYRDDAGRDQRSYQGQYRNGDLGNDSGRFLNQSLSQNQDQQRIGNAIPPQGLAQDRDLSRQNLTQPGTHGIDIALENEEMENALVGFLLGGSNTDLVERNTRSAYLNQLVDPVQYENQARLLQVLKKKKELRQFVREELHPTRERRVPPRQVLLKPILLKMQEQATRKSPARIIQIGGAVRYTGKYPLEPGMRISNLLLAGGGLSEPAYSLEAEISHFEVDDDQSMRMRHSTVDLFKVIQGDPAADQILQPYDIVIIKQNPKWAEVNSVIIEGNVRFPGVYPIQPGEKLTQAVERAGGLTELAYPESAVFTRKALKEKERRENHNLIARMETQLMQTLYNKQSDKEAAAPTTVMIEELVAKLRNTKPMGRLSIDLPEILSNPNGASDLMLQDGDRLVIPQRTDEITVMGEVYFPTSHQFLSDKDAETYIQASGGYTTNADDDSVYIVRANGSVSSKKQKGGFPGFGWFASVDTMRLGPGDTVVVPMNVEKIPSLTLWKDISQVLYNLAVTTTALRSAGAF
ncbi:MAG: SLBB domain-containing protein [Magnetococcales bacterium]|nr:SLBB domain-containing protein [Magnetococcales bacterium]